jgi:hypothetical protein
MTTNVGNRSSANLPLPGVPAPTALIPQNGGLPFHPPFGIGPAVPFWHGPVVANPQNFGTTFTNRPSAIGTVAAGVGSAISGATEAEVLAAPEVAEVSPATVMASGIKTALQ